MLHLLMTRRFAPLFATQFLGAFNDNLYKTAMLFLITYHLMGDDVQAGATVVMLAGGVFILPFFLFSGMAGQLADSRDKAWVIRMVKTAEVAIMAVGAWALMSDSIALLMLVLFAMGVHSAFFGPVKYAILPQHLAEGEVLAGTGLVEAGTFIAILCGQIMGGLLPAPFAALAVLGVAALGWIAGRLVPPALPLDVARDMVLHPWRNTVDMLRDLRSDPLLLRVVLAISWFWALGAVLTSQFVPLVKGVLHADASVATLFLVMFSIGIGAGSLLVGCLLRGRIKLTYVPLAGFGISCFLGDLYLALNCFDVHTGSPLLALSDFLQRADGLRVMFDLFGLSLAAGIFVVPLYARLQTCGDFGRRARTVAVNNIANACFMVGAAFIVMCLLAIGLNLLQVLLFIMFTNVAVLGLIVRV